MNFVGSYSGHRITGDCDEIWSHRSQGQPNRFEMVTSTKAPVRQTKFSQDGKVFV